MVTFNPNLVSTPSISELKPFKKRILHTAQTFSKGVSEALNRGMHPLLLTSKNWKEAVITPQVYAGNHELTSAFATWTGSSSKHSFHNWLVESKPVSWFSEDDTQTPKLQYLDDPAPYKIEIQHGRLIGLQSLDSQIFVLGPNKCLYAGTKVKGIFHHSSFLQGKATLAAGKLQCNSDGKIIAIDNQSGHYRPGAASLLRFLRILFEKGCDLGALESINISDETKSTEYHTLCEFLRSIRLLKGGSTIEILATLQFLKAFGIDYDKIYIQKSQNTLQYTVKVFLEKLTEIEASNDTESRKQAFLFLQSQGFDCKKITHIVTRKHQSAIPLIQDLLKESPSRRVDSFTIDIQASTFSAFSCKLI